MTRDPYVNSFSPHLPLDKYSQRSLYFSAAADHRENFNLPMIGITGSNGKTTLKELLRKTLSRVGCTLYNEENYNTKPAIAEKILDLNKHHQFGVFEMGARKYKDLDWPVKMVHPEIAICLNIGKAHLGVFGEFEKLKKTKLSVFSNHSHLKTCIINADDPELTNWASKCKRDVVSFGRSENSDIQIMDIQKKTSWEYSFSVNGKSLKLKSNYYHSKFSECIAAAISVLYTLDLPFSLLDQELENYSPPKGRFQISSYNGYTFVNDAFNSSPESIMSGLQTLKNMYPNESPQLVIGDQLELGDNSEEIHHKLVLKGLELFPNSHILCVGNEMAKLKPLMSQNHKISFLRCAQEIELDRFICESPTPAIFYFKSSKAIGLHQVCNKLIEKQRGFKK